MASDTVRRGGIDGQHERTPAPFGPFLEALPDAIVIIDSEGCIALVNGHTEKLFGYARDELVGRPVETLLPHRLRDVHVSHREGYRDDPRTRPMGIGLQLYGMRKSGTEFPVDISLSPLPTDDGILLTAAIRDMTDRLRAEEVRDRLAAIVEFSDDAIIGKAIDGTILSWNRGAHRIYGYTADEAVGQSIALLMPPGREDELRRILAVIANGDALEHFEAVRMRKDGTILSVSVTISPTRDSAGRVSGASTIARDVTEQKRMEAARDEFIANAAHELRTPLATLAGLGEILARHLHDMTEEQVNRSLEALQRQGERASVLVANLLDLSQLDGGRVRFTLETVDVGDAVKRAIDAAPAPPEAEIGMVVPAGLSVHVDAMRLEQVFTNLLTNAYRYGGDHIEVAAEAINGHVLVHVADNGPGVPPEIVHRVFEPFARGSNAESHGGSGIGLALCRRLVEAFGGEISYEWQRPSGGRFTVALPRR